MAVRRALFVELLGGIGDLVFALPSIDALSQTYPGASLDVLTFAPGGELLDGDPRVDRVLYAHHGSDADSVAAMRRDVDDALSRGDYDLVVGDARHSGLHDLIGALPIARKVTQLWSGAGRDEPISRLFLRRLREERIVDASIGDPPARLFLRADERRVADAMWSGLGASPGRTIVLNVHSGVAVKQWPREHFITAGRRLGDAGWTIAVLAGDAPLRAWEVAEAIPGARFVPRVSLRQSAACLAKTALVISGDSGLAHVASAVGAPVLAIFGPTWAGRYGVAAPSINLGSPFACSERNPLNFTTQRCWDQGRCIFSGKLTCCEDVTPEEVLAAAADLLGVGKANGRHGLLPLPLEEGWGEGPGRAAQPTAAGPSPSPSGRGKREPDDQPQHDADYAGRKREGAGA